MVLRLRSARHGGANYIRISRLTDPEFTNKSQNLTLSVLAADPRVESVPGLREDLQEAIEKIREDAKPIHAHRNKSVAHIDHALAMLTPDFDNRAKAAAA